LTNRNGYDCRWFAYDLRLVCTPRPSSGFDRRDSARDHRFLGSARDDDL